MDNNEIRDYLNAHSNENTGISGGVIVGFEKCSNYLIRLLLGFGEGCGYYY